MSMCQLTRHDGAPPIYHQIKEILMRDIRTDYQAGEKLPSEGELAMKFGVNRHTLRRAIDDLVKDGMVERRHGVGVIVVQPSIDYAIGQNTRFTATLASHGHSTTSKVLSMATIPAQGGVANRLKLALGAPVIHIETLRFVDEQPFCVIAHFLPNEHCEAVLTAYAGGSLHECLEKHYGYSLYRTESLVSAILPEPEDVRHLNMPRHEPALRVKSVNVCADRQIPIEYAVTRFRGISAQLLIRP